MELTAIWISAAINITLLRSYEPAINITLLGSYEPAINITLLRSYEPAINITLLRSYEPAINITLLRSYEPAMNITLLRSYEPFTHRCDEIAHFRVILFAGSRFDSGCNIDRIGPRHLDGGLHIFGS